MVIFHGRGHYPGEAYMVPDEDEYIQKDRIQKLTKVHTQIKSLYLSGTPLYSREAIQDVCDQLKRLDGSSGTVSIRGLDGISVEVAIETGRTMPFGPEKEYIIGAPIIQFCTFERLTTIHDYLYTPLRLAYCSFRIHHYMDLRSKVTKEILHEDWAPESPEDSGKIFEWDEQRSEEETRQTFQLNQQRWESSEECKQLKPIIQKIGSQIDVEQIIAFACGPIWHDAVQDIIQSSYQHALILTLRSILKKGKEKKDNVSCYAQDPAYTEADVSVLREHEITVLDNPEGFLKVDDSTLVISCAPDAPVKQVVMDLARPAAMIWNRVKEDRNDGRSWSDPDTSRIRDMIRESYDVFEFPGQKENFSDLALYIRRTIGKACTSGE